MRYITSGNDDADFLDMLMRTLKVDFDTAPAEVLAWVALKFKPEQVFAESDLAEWALKSGFVPADSV